MHLDLLRPAGAKGPLSRAQEGTLTWGLVLLSSCLAQLGPSHIYPLLGEVQALVDRGMQAGGALPWGRGGGRIPCWGTRRGGVLAC